MTKSNRSHDKAESSLPYCNFHLSSILAVLIRFRLLVCRHFLTTSSLLDPVKLLSVQIINIILAILILFASANNEFCVTDVANFLNVYVFSSKCDLVTI